MITRRRFTSSANASPKPPPALITHRPPHPPHTHTHRAHYMTPRPYAALWFSADTQLDDCGPLIRAERTLQRTRTPYTIDTSRPPLVYLYFEAPSLEAFDTARAQTIHITDTARALFCDCMDCDEYADELIEELTSGGAEHFKQRLEQMRETHPAAHARAIAEAPAWAAAYAHPADRWTRALDLHAPEIISALESDEPTALNSAIASLKRTQQGAL